MKQRGKDSFLLLLKRKKIKCYSGRLNEINSKSQLKHFLGYAEVGIYYES